MSERARQIALRIGFVLLLAGGLFWWSRARSPKDLQIVVDLTDALPGAISEVDVAVVRDGHALVRHDERFPKRDAPQKLRLQVRAPPGPAEVEATLVYADKPALRVRGKVELREDAPAELAAR